MLFYSQTKGVFTDDNGEVQDSGCYAGIGQGKNNPDMQAHHDVGPLPQGVFTMGPLTIHPPNDPLRHLGPCIELVPDANNQMFGRSGFFIHLDNPAHPGMSSNGCIVCQNDINMTGSAKLQKLDRLRAGGETRLTVIE